MIIRLLGFKTIVGQIKISNVFFYYRDLAVFLEKTKENWCVTSLWLIARILKMLTLSIFLLICLLFLWRSTFAKLFSFVLFWKLWKKRYFFFQQKAIILKLVQKRNRNSLLFFCLSLTSHVYCSVLITIAVFEKSHMVFRFFIQPLKS